MISSRFKSNYLKNYIDRPRILNLFLHVLTCDSRLNDDFDISLFSCMIQDQTFHLIKHWMLIVNPRSLLLYLKLRIRKWFVSMIYDFSISRKLLEINYPWSYLSLPFVLLVCHSIQNVITIDVDINHWKLMTRNWASVILEQETRRK